MALTKSSFSGEQAGMTDTDPVLATFGKHPADFVGATATSSQPPLLSVGVSHLSGVSAARLLDAMLTQAPDAKVPKRIIGGVEATYVESGAWPVWYYPSGENLYGILGGDDTVAKIVGMLH